MRARFQQPRVSRNRCCEIPLPQVIREPKGHTTDMLDIVALIVSIVLIVAGLTGNTFFYASGLMGDSSGKRMPTWKGRAFFLFGGLFFLLLALRYLVLLPGGNGFR